MTNAIFMTSTPLHSLWSLAIAAGAFPSARCSLTSIDLRDGDRDFIAEAIAARLPAPFVETHRFDQIGKKPLQKLVHARKRIVEVKQYAIQFAPDYIAVGNDRRVEFHAALAAAPNAIGAYVDDGTASYSAVPAKAVAQSVWTRRVINKLRSWSYGVPTEREPYIGVSKAVREAWVMLPEHVHAGLRQKPLKQIRPEWFQLPVVQEICADAIQRAGLNRDALHNTTLLLALPHDSLLRDNVEIRNQLQKMLEHAHAAGGRVALKRHPRSREMLLDLPATGVVEIPLRLPLEIVAPLLSGTEVVGVLTSALIYLHLLGDDIRATTFVPPSLAAHPIVDIYRQVGVKIIQ